MFRFLKNVVGGLSRTSQARPGVRTVRPRVEGLEDRWCPTVSVSNPIYHGVVDTHTLIITRDDAGDTVTINQDDANSTLTVSSPGMFTRLYTSSVITRMSIDLGGGDDTLNWNLVSSTFSKSKDATINLGTGADDAQLWLGGGVGAQSVNTATLKIDLKGGGNADTLVANLGAKQGGELSLKADMGAGNDEIDANLWGDITAGAKVTLDLQGGTGNDRLNSWDTYDGAAGVYNSLD